MVEKLKASGVTIIYISHRMEEIFRLTERITVMRDGQKIATLNTRDTNLDALVKLMVGRELKETYPKRKDCISNDVLLDVKNLTGNGVHDLSFQIRKGEVLGFAGLIGAGRTELAELLFGVKRKTGGGVVLNGKESNPKSPREAIDKGIALVPEDRKKQGALLDVDIRGNISMAIPDQDIQILHGQSERRKAHRKLLERCHEDQNPEYRAEGQKFERGQPAKGNYSQMAGGRTDPRHFR